MVYDRSASVLAILKLRNIENFSNMFLGYDLLAQRWVRYSCIYALAEALAGILMVAGVLMWLDSGDPVHRDGRRLQQRAAWLRFSILKT